MIRVAIRKSLHAWCITFTYHTGHKRRLYAGSWDAACRIAAKPPVFEERAASPAPQRPQTQQVLGFTRRSLRELN